MLAAPLAALAQPARRFRVGLLYGSSREGVASEMASFLARMEEMVVSDPEIMHGTPVFKGTRIPVDLVADMLAQGATAEEILEGYPTLNKEKIAIAPLYMRAFPRRGRPSRRLWQGKKPRGRKSYPLSSLLRSA